MQDRPRGLFVIWLRGPVQIPELPEAVQVTLEALADHCLLLLPIDDDPVGFADRPINLGMRQQAVGIDQPLVVREVVNNLIDVLEDGAEVLPDWSLDRWEEFLW